jgi:hypothetical protein
MKRGNFLPVIVSALLLIVIGFWMVIPVFGLVIYEKKKSARPIRERFLAEAGFLKKYKSLYYYLDTYRREQRLAAEEPEEPYNYREIINKLRSVYDGTDKS